jgi:hypothetical protein
MPSAFDVLCRRRRSGFGIDFERGGRANQFFGVNTRSVSTFWIFIAQMQISRLRSMG